MRRAECASQKQRKSESFGDAQSYLCEREPYKPPYCRVRVTVIIIVNTTNSMESFVAVLHYALRDAAAPLVVHAVGTEAFASGAIRCQAFNAPASPA